MWRPWENNNYEHEVEGPIEEDSYQLEDLQGDYVERKRNIKYLSNDAKGIVKNVYQGLCSELTKSEAITETVFLTKVPKSTVYAIIGGKSTSRKKRKDSGKFRKIESYLIQPISITIYEMYAANIFPTVETIRHELIRKNIVSCSATTLRVFLKANNFKYGTIDKRQILMESSRIISLRNEYIRNIMEYRKMKRNIVYLDETWYDTHDTVKKGWKNNNKKCSVALPSNKGKRIIILHCGGENGWINDALLISAKKIKDASLDYHDDMDSCLFESWFEKTLLPKLPKNSVIVMDNASYHSRLIKQRPNTSWNKSQIQQFLYEEDLYFEETYTKKQLLEVTQIKQFQKEYVVDDCALNNGHTVLRLPPYFCILNPIELIWAQLKGNIRRKNVAPKLSSAVLQLIAEEVKNITSTSWKNAIEHVIGVENEYAKYLPTLTNLIITLDNTSDDSDMMCDSDSE